MSRPLYIYVDVDETLVRNYGAKRIPMPSVIKHVKNLHEQGAVLYCWSSGGADYGKRFTRMPAKVIRSRTIAHSSSVE